MLYAALEVNAQPWKTKAFVNTSKAVAKMIKVWSELDVTMIANLSLFTDFST